LSLVTTPFGANCNAALGDGYSNTVVFIKTAVSKKRPKGKKIQMGANNREGRLFTNTFSSAAVAAGVVQE